MALDALFAAYLEAHARTDLESVLELFGEDAELEDPVGSPLHRGRAAIRSFYAQTHARNGPLGIERVGPAIQCGEELVAHVRARILEPGAPPAMDVVYWLRADPAGRIGALRVWY